MYDVIDIPQRTLGKFGYSFGKFLSIVQKFNNCSSQKIIFDFRRAEMLNPFVLGGTAALISQSFEKGKNVQINLGSNSKINSYLQTIEFSNGCDPEKFNKRFNELKDKTYIPLIRFPGGDSKLYTAARDQLLDLLSNLLRAQIKLNQKESSPIVYLLSELTTNISEHSESIYGFVFGQFYKTPNNYLDICICDHGKGIYESYRNNIKFKPTNEIQALDFALTGKSTKNRSESRGYGISTSRNILSSGLHGRFLLWSGDSAYVETPEHVGIVSFPQGSYYQGTYIALRIPTVIPGNFDLIKFLE